MSLRDELADRWGLLTAAVTGGLGWALLETAFTNSPPLVPVGIGVGIGLAVLGVKVLTGSVVNRDAVDEGDLDIIKGSPEEAWLRRAELAARSLREVASSARPGPIADRLREVVGESTSTLGVRRPR